MPITQTRMMTLLDAAEELLESQERLARFAQSIRDNQVVEAIKALHAHNIDENHPMYETLHSMNDAIDQFVERANTPPNLSTLRTILREREHFELRAKSNISAANWHRRRRALSTPLSTDTTGE